MRLPSMLLASYLLTASANAVSIAFNTIDINPDAGTSPAVALNDIEADGDLDIVVMGNEDISWYENPGWARHVISGQIENLNVCMALGDLDGDKLPEIAAGADWQFENTESGGSLHVLVRGDDAKQPWQRAQLLNEPSIHRIRWADTDGDGAQELFVAPLKGRKTSGPDFREAGVRLLQLRPPAKLLEEPWPVEVVTEQYHVMHNLIPFRAADDHDALLTVSFEGIALLNYSGSKWNSRLVSEGNPQPWPRSGASEIKTGRLAKGVSAMATVEPWHGNIVAVYTPATPGRIDQVKEWKRHVLDESFNQGHALGWADFDGDGRDELVAGYREPSPTNERVGMYLYTFGAFSPGGNLTFERTAIDDGGMATEDLAIGDINGDGTPDIVAVGRATHNVRAYLTVKIHDEGTAE